MHCISISPGLVSMRYRIWPAKPSLMVTSDWRKKLSFALSTGKDVHTALYIHTPMCITDNLCIHIKMPHKSHVINFTFMYAHTYVYLRQCVCIETCIHRCKL